jgi:hypothetical protein
MDELLMKDGLLVCCDSLGRGMRLAFEDWQGDARGFRVVKVRYSSCCIVLVFETKVGIMISKQIRYRTLRMKLWGMVTTVVRC